MRKFIFFIAVLICIPAHADTVPASIQKTLKPLEIQSIGFSSGVLRVVMRAPMINLDKYRMVTEFSVCNTLFSDKKLAARISKIEVLNDIGAQGYALEGGGKTCMALLDLNRDQSNKYISDHTVNCIAGNCTKR